MNIALIGYGKMGKAIEEIAVQRGHRICLIINSQNKNDLTKKNLKKADVAIEFTNPESAVDNILECFAARIPIICGTTGWLKELKEIKKMAKQKKGALLYASNFSIGVNIFFELNTKLAKLMKPQSGYNVFIEETHHTQKKDAPSGTAITLAESVLKYSDQKKTWINANTADIDKLSIISNRIDEIPGTHRVKYNSQIDDIDIIHTAHNRKGFATGAVVAAEFLINKQGVFTMKDVLEI